MPLEGPNRGRGAPDLDSGRIERILGAVLELRTSALAQSDRGQC